MVDDVTVDACDAVELFVFRHDDHLSGFIATHNSCIGWCLSSRVIEKVCHQIEIKITIHIIVTKRWGVASTYEIQTKTFRRLNKLSIALIDEELVSRIVITNIDIKITVLVDVNDGRTCAP